MTHRHIATGAARLALAAAGLLALGACAIEPEQPSFVAPQTPPDTNVYFYPAQGRTISADQQDRDKFECNDWAVRNTGFDPSAPNIAPHQQVRIVAGGPAPGAGVAVGAVSGAIIGGAVSNPWHAGRGTILGAIAGAAIGGITDAERAAQTDRLQAEANADAASAANAALEQRATQYRRAMAACLEGRGYSVR